MRIKFRFILLNLILSLTLLYGQENPNVELPQFVITGKEIYEFPQLEKQKPELVSTVSEQFFKPVYEPDELEVKEFPEPTTRNGEFLDSIRFINGEGYFLTGNNILPSLSLNYRLLMERSLFSANVNALNQRAYIPNADRNKFGIKLLYNYIISDSSDYLPFSKLNASAIIENESYKLFASPVPDFNRQFFHVNFLISLQNISSTEFNYDLTIEDNYINLKNDFLKENILKMNGYTKYITEDYDVSLFGKYDLLSSTFGFLPFENYTFIQAKGMFGFSTGNLVRTNIGLEYSKLDAKRTFYPYIAAAFQFGNGLSSLAEYNPTSEMLTQQDFITTNKYYTPTTQIKNIFYSINTRYSFSLKYEYERIFEITGGFSFFSALNYPYFSNDSIGVNRFQINTAEAKVVSAFARINLYAGELGFFTGEVIFQSVQGATGKSIPYATPVHTSVTYGLLIDPEISLSATMMYYSSSFINFANTENGKDYFNLILKGEMNISEKMFAQLELQNIFNQKNETWKNYRELPLSISAGLKIIW